MEDNEISETIFEKADDGDKEALKEVIAYYKSIDDEENAVFYQMKLNELSDAVQENKIKDNTFKYDYQEELDAYLNGEYDNLIISELRANKEHNPYFFILLAKKYYDAKQYIEAAEYYDKSLKLLENANHKSNDEIIKTISLEADALHDVLFFAYPQTEEEIDFYGKKLITICNNGIEIEHISKDNESEKCICYNHLDYCYRRGYGCQRDIDKANEYRKLSSRFVISCALEESVISFNAHKKVEEEEWIEVALYLVKNNLYTTLGGNSEDYKKCLELKLALRNKDNKINIEEYQDILNDGTAYGCFNNEEVKIIYHLCEEKNIQVRNLNYKMNEYIYREELENYLCGEYENLPFSSLGLRVTDNPYILLAAADWIANTKKQYDSVVHIVAKALECATNGNIFSDAYALYETFFRIARYTYLHLLETDFNIETTNKWGKVLFVTSIKCLEASYLDREITNYRNNRLYYYAYMCYANGYGTNINKSKANEYWCKFAEYQVYHSLQLSVIYDDEKEMSDKWFDNAQRLVDGPCYKELWGNDDIYFKIFELKKALRNNENIDIKEYLPSLIKANEKANLDDLFTNSDKEKILIYFKENNINNDFFEIKEVVEEVSPIEDVVNDTNVATSSKKSSGIFKAIDWFTGKK